MTDFTQLVDLASERLGGRVLVANDEFFAPKENLLKPSKPVFVEDRYTDRGKWMDGWETRRRRTPGHDWCIIRLGLPGILRGVLIDTSHFKGNYPEQCSLDACALAAPASQEQEIEQLTAPSSEWVELLPRSPLRGDTHNLFPISDARRFTHVRFKIYPDGGVARLRVHGEIVPDWQTLLTDTGLLDLAGVASGGRVVASSDQFFSAPQNLLMPARALNMGDGWETRRRRGPGFDWVVVELRIPGLIHQVQVDTSHFKGNFPESCSLEGCDAGKMKPEELSVATLEWKELLPRTPLQADALHRFDKEIRDIGPVTYVRFNIFPDGGVSRLRIFGTPRKWSQNLVRLNAQPAQEAEAAFLQCCGSAKWARAMTAQRPFQNAFQLFEAAERLFATLHREDWLEAFRSHPRIGEKKVVVGPPAAAAQWSEQEQSSVCRASARLLEELSEANRAYLERFGYIFIVRATGRSSEEMLTIVKQRLSNDAETELRIAAAEQKRITQLRLGKLLEQ